MDHSKLIKYLGIQDTIKSRNSAFKTKPRSEGIVRIKFRSVMHTCVVLKKYMLKCLHFSVLNIMRISIKNKAGTTYNLHFT